MHNSRKQTVSYVIHWTYAKGIFHFLWCCIVGSLWPVYGLYGNLWTLVSRVYQLKADVGLLNLFFYFFILFSGSKSDLFSGSRRFPLHMLEPRTKIKHQKGHSNCGLWLLCLLFYVVLIKYKLKILFYPPPLLFTPIY